MRSIKNYYDNSMVWLKPEGVFLDILQNLIDESLKTLENQTKWTKECEDFFSKTWRACMFLADIVEDQELKKFTKEKYKEILNDTWKEGIKKRFLPSDINYNLQNPDKGLKQEEKEDEK